MLNRRVSRATFEIVTAVLVKNPAFRVMAPCRLVCMCQDFGGACDLHILCSPRSRGLGMSLNTGAFLRAGILFGKHSTKYCSTSTRFRTGNGVRNGTWTSETKQNSLKYFAWKISWMTRLHNSYAQVLAWVMWECNDRWTWCKMIIYWRLCSRKIKMDSLNGILRFSYMLINVRTT